MARALTPAVQNVINAAVQTYALPEYTQDQHRGLASAAIAPRIVIAHFLMRQPATQRNDSTDGTSLFLHGNRIAWWVQRRHVCQTPGVMVWELHVSDAGWATPTTRSRLRLLPGVYGLCGSKLGEQYGHSVMLARRDNNDTYGIGSPAHLSRAWWAGADWITYLWFHKDGVTINHGPSTPPEMGISNARPQPERKGVDCRDGTAEKRGWQSRG